MYVISERIWRLKYTLKYCYNMDVYKIVRFPRFIMNLIGFHYFEYWCIARSRFSVVAPAINYRLNFMHHVVLENKQRQINNRQKHNFMKTES
jgi:hypothetical protein